MGLNFGPEILAPYVFPVTESPDDDDDDANRLRGYLKNYYRFRILGNSWVPFPAMPSDGIIGNCVIRTAPLD